MSTDKRPKKAGRPKAITPEIQEKVLALVTSGAFVGQACVQAGVGYSTLARKEIEDGEFGRLLARARVAGASLHLEESDRMIREAKTHEDIGRARELAIHRRWVASKLIPAYSDRIGVEVTTPEAAMTPLELGRRVAFLNTMIAKPQADPGRVLPHKAKPVDAEFVIPEIAGVTPAPKLPGFQLPEGVTVRPATKGATNEPEPLGGSDPDRDVF